MVGRAIVYEYKLVVSQTLRYDRFYASLKVVLYIIYGYDDA